MALARYRQMRNFRVTPEPAGARVRARKKKSGGVFVVQLHHATRVHYDFRLEMDGALKSWAVPKGPSYDPRDKRLAVEVEDHPLEYGGFEGVIPEGQYGAGPVMVWDTGTWELKGEDDALNAHRNGSVKIHLRGEKLKGGWALVRMSRLEGGKPQWLLIKEKDETARVGYDVAKQEARSAKTGRTIEQIARGAAKRGEVWQSSRNGSLVADPKRTSSSRGAPSSAGQNGAVRRVRGASNGRLSKADAPPIAGAVRRSMPQALSPQLATLVESVPTGDDWVHEIKLDGYRMLAFVEGKAVRLMTRKGLDWASRFESVVAELARLGLPACILDGELVALEENGISRFQLLQRAMQEHRPGRLVYFVFDIVYFDGWDLAACRLKDRRELLEREFRRALGKSAAGSVRLSDQLSGRGDVVFREACKLGLEGLVSKGVNSPYVSARTTAWVKTRCSNRQELVIGGFSEPKNSRVGFGSLLLGYYDGEDFIYAGRVGTGFDDKLLKELAARLKALVRPTSPFKVTTAEARAGRARWVEPKLVAEVAFTEWTSDGRLRHPVFLGLREDKEARQVAREKKVRGTERGKKSKGGRAESATRKIASGKEEAAGVRISNPGRIVFKDAGITKLDVVRYYEAVWEEMKPYVVDRPLSIVRCPEGSTGQCFFQKHLDAEKVKGLRFLSVRESKGVGRYAAVTDLPGLIYLVQMNALELHGWQSTADQIERPDQLVFDLDPGASLPWSRVAAGARAVRAALEDRGLESFVKTSGGKGLHVVAPIRPKEEWDAVKAYCLELAQELEAKDPDRYVSNMSKAKRVGRIFIDYLRNQRGATSVLPFSTRARPGAAVSMPIEWEAIGRLRADSFGVRNAVAHLKRRKRDPWERFAKVSQSI